MRNRLKTGSEKSGKKAVSPSLPDKYVSSSSGYPSNSNMRSTSWKSISLKTAVQENNRTFQQPEFPPHNLPASCARQGLRSGNLLPIYGKHTVMKTYQKNGENKKRHPPFRRTAFKILRRLG
ncbi:hypothetical protein C1I88_01825 [Akkermansia muciniphila]|jgi:ribosomal protein L37E|nr:hypothetical protein C1I88_01825 [Akkermansia muciniphila]